MTKEKLIRDCQKGIKSSQYELVKRYAGMLMTVARRYAKDEPMAKDILQESLIKIFSNINTYRPTGSFEAWMRTITIRCGLAAIRKNKNGFTAEEEILDHSMAVEPFVFHKFDFEEVIKVVQLLPEGFRSVFNLALIEGYTHKEIAQLLKISESTSRSQLTRAKRFFNKLWHQQHSSLTKH